MSNNCKRIVVAFMVALTGTFIKSGNNCLLAMSKCRGELDVDIIWALAVQHFPHNMWMMVYEYRSLLRCNDIKLRP